MKKTRVIVVSFLSLFIAQQAQCGLTVLEMVAGQKVTLDTNTGNYWYYGLTRFDDKTYNEQINEISGLGTYGNIAGGWHLATFSEMTALWSYSGDTIGSNFEPAGYGAPSPNAEIWAGRFEWKPQTPDEHGYAGIYHMASGSYNMDILGDKSIPDLDTSAWISAWVTTDAQVVPVPPAVILTMTGVLTSALGLNILRRKHRE